MVDEVSDVSLIYGHRGSLGPVWVLAPVGDPGFSTVGWSPVDYAGDAESADRMAEWLVEASGMSADPKGAAVAGAGSRAPVRGGIDAFMRWVYEGRDAVDDVR